MIGFASCFVGLTIASLTGKETKVREEQKFHGYERSTETKVPGNESATVL